MNASTLHPTQWKYALLLFCTLVIAPLPTLAAETMFSWLPNNEPDIIGYRISYGEQSGVYTQEISIDNPQIIDGRIHASLTGLADATTYYAVISVYSATIESDSSNEISWTTAPASAVPPPTPQIISVRETP